MSPEPSTQTQTDRLTVEDFEAALDLVSAEAKFKSADRSKIVVTAITDVSIGLLVVSFIQGLITLTYSIKWGLSLLVLSFASLVIMLVTILSPYEVSSLTKGIRTTIAESKFGDAAGAGWKNRQDSGCLVTTLLLIFILSTISLIYGSYVQSRTIVLGSLIIGGLSGIAVGVYLAVDDIREYQYFSQVSQLQENFESRRILTESGQGVFVSPKEKELLSQIEQTRVERNVAKALEAGRLETVSVYSIALSPTALDQLRALPEKTRYELRTKIDLLQSEPRLNAVDLKHDGDSSRQTYELRVGLYVCVYAVSDEKQRVDVIEIRKRNEGGAYAS